VVDLRKVKAYMILNGWNERQMALNMGLSSAMLSRVFRGERNPGGQFIQGLLRVGMSPSDIFLPLPLPKVRKGAPT